MPAVPKEIAAFMATYGVTADEVWKIPQGNAYAIKHKALERVAAEQSISFDKLTVIQADIGNKIAAVAVSGKMGERTEFSTGEAAPYNNKNGYPLAMAEKRAKDRVTLKLLQAHGALYSEDEIDDTKRENPHVTRPADILPEVQYDQYGEPIDNIPRGDPRIDPMPKAKSRAEFSELQAELRRQPTPETLAIWGKNNCNRVESLPNDWQQMLRGLYTEHMTDLRKAKEAA